MIIINKIRENSLKSYKYRSFFNIMIENDLKCFLVPNNGTKTRRRVALPMIPIENSEFNLYNSFNSKLGSAYHCAAFLE